MMRRYGTSGDGGGGGGGSKTIQSQGRVWSYTRSGCREVYFLTDGATRDARECIERSRTEGGVLYAMMAKITAGGD